MLLANGSCLLCRFFLCRLFLSFLFASCTISSILSCFVLFCSEGLSLTTKSSGVHAPLCFLLILFPSRHEAIRKWHLEGYVFPSLPQTSFSGAFLLLYLLQIYSLGHVHRGSPCMFFRQTLYFGHFTLAQASSFFWTTGFGFGLA